MGENHRAVGIEHILLRALEVVLRGHLGEVVLLRQGPGFGEAPLGDPAAVGDAELYGCVEGRLVGSGLAAADDLGEHDTSRGWRSLLENDFVPLLLGQSASQHYSFKGGCVLP